MYEYAHRDSICSLVEKSKALEEEALYQTRQTTIHKVDQAASSVGQFVICLAAALLK